MKQLLIFLLGMFLFILFLFLTALFLHVAAFGCDAVSHAFAEGTESITHTHRIGEHDCVSHTHGIEGKNIRNTVINDRGLTFRSGGFHHDRDANDASETPDNEQPAIDIPKQVSIVAGEPEGIRVENEPATGTMGIPHATNTSYTAPICTRDLRIVDVIEGARPPRIHVTLRNTSDRSFQSLYGLTLEMRDSEGHLKRRISFWEGLSITYQKSVGEVCADTDLVLFAYRKGFERYQTTVGEKKFMFPYRIKSVGGYQDTDVFVLMCGDQEISRHPEVTPMSPVRQRNMATTWASMKRRK